MGLKKSSGTRQKVVLALGVLVNLLPLFLFKYLHFTVEALTPIFVFAGKDGWLDEKSNPAEGSPGKVIQK